MEAHTGSRGSKDASFRPTAASPAGWIAVLRRTTSLALVAVGLLAGCQGPAPAPVRQAPVARRAPRPRPVVRLETPPPAPAVCRETVQLGRSLENQPIEMIVFGSAGPTLLVMGGIHGNEPTSAELAHHLIDYLDQHPEDYRDQRIAVIPTVNPDGLRRGTRHNAHDIDLNRNFPASNFPKNPPSGFVGGPYPGSERETRAVMAAVRKLKPAKIISIHSIARGRHGNNFDGAARSLAAEMSRHNGYPVLPTMGYPTPGSFGSWAGKDLSIPTITLELPRDAGAETCWQTNRPALLAAIAFPIERCGGYAAHQDRPASPIAGK